MVLKPDFEIKGTVQWRIEYLHALFKNPNLKWIRILSIDSSFYATSQLESTLSSFIGHIPDNSLERVEIDCKYPLKHLNTVIMRKSQPRIQNLNLNPILGNQLQEWALAQHPYQPSTRYLLECTFYQFPFEEVGGMLPILEIPRLKFLKFVSCEGNFSDACSPYPTLISTKLDRITHLSCHELMMKHDSIIPLNMFPSLTHLALDDCSYIGASLAAYKSPTLKDLRIRCYILYSTNFPRYEELEDIGRLLSRFNGLELLALDPSWTTSIPRYQSDWLRILLAISNNHASTLKGLVLREFPSTDITIEMKRARIEAAKKCKSLRVLEVMNVEEIHTTNFFVRSSSFFLTL